MKGRCPRPLDEGDLELLFNDSAARLNLQSGAGNETRTRDPDLGKVVLYQLSYSRLSYRRAPFYIFITPSQAFDSKKLFLFGGDAQMRPCGEQILRHGPQRKRCSDEQQCIAHPVSYTHLTLPTTPYV